MLWPLQERYPPLQRQRRQLARRHCRPPLFRRFFFIGLLILNIEIVWRSVT
ncbi:hypothetical protein M621_11755 [Serratia plymuthica S13]|uniref:Uncharacterized protein n=1 Tax=Serratia plymuthica S13 TaxID=1348660 RepID=S4YRI7_SERPL|nr:hypothetical protein M621_11755 [Serratia plymuthica S13]